MKKSNKGVALLAAATLATGLTACTKEEAIQEYEKEKTEVVDTINENDKLNNEELFKKIQEGNATKEEIEAYMNNVATKDDINELKEIIEKYMATTEPTTTPAVTTNYTTALAGTTTYQTTISEEQKQITMRTHETRGPVPSNSTTTTTTETVYTTTMPTQQTYLEELLVEPTFKERKESIELPFITLDVTNKYIGKANGGSTVQGDGEGIYAIAKLYESEMPKTNDKKNQAEILDEIRTLNAGKSDYILVGETRNVPFTLYYCTARSVSEASKFTGIPAEKIAELNRVGNPQEVFPEGTKLLVRISKAKEDYYTNDKGTRMAILDNGLVVAADDHTKINDRTYLILHKISENENQVDLVYINGNYVTTTEFASNVKGVMGGAVICSDDTKIYIHNAVSVYTDGKNTIVTPGQLPENPFGYRFAGNVEEPGKKLSLTK